jgi:hypothetical protein
VIVVGSTSFRAWGAVMILDFSAIWRYKICSKRVLAKTVASRSRISSPDEP